MTLTSATTSALPYVAFRVRLAGRRRLSPSFVRLTLAGAALADVHDGGAAGPCDTRVKLVVPDRPGVPPPIALRTDDDGWYRRWRALDPALRGHLRTYTLRAVRRHLPVPEVDLDVVLHADPDGGGPASTWAAAAPLGEPVTLLGPNRHHPAPGGIEWRPPRPAGDRPVPVLLAGDETAVPAVSAILERLGDGYVGDAVLEVPSAPDVLPVQAPPGLRLTWVVREGDPHGAGLQAAVTRVLADRPRRPWAGPPETDLDTGPLWEVPEGPAADPGSLYAWLAGEAATIRELRRLLVGQHQVPRGSVAFMGYWRRGRPEAS